MKKRALAGVVVLAAALAIPVFAATPALAHEERTVGAYHFLVGFGDEPPYAGVKNSVQLILSDGNGKPVTDLTDSLKVEVIFGAEKMQFPLESTFDPDTGLGTPGDYRAWLIPTSPGTYTFHFFGTIGTQTIDEKFTSGPTTFDNVTDPTEVEFPSKVPTGAELATRLDREFPRFRHAAEAAASRARHQADSAKTFGIIGIVVGILGIGVGAAALIASRRRTAPTATPQASAEIGRS